MAEPAEFVATPDGRADAAEGPPDPGYWRGNLTITFVLLAVWAAVGLGCGVLFADQLNGVHIGGFPLGFWFAQQGSIAVFVVLILIYAIGMNRLDRRYARRASVEERRS